MDGWRDDDDKGDVRTRWRANRMFTASRARRATTRTTAHALRALKRARPTTTTTTTTTRAASRSTPSAMRGVKKENLPSKVCVVCDRPFTWRKKWENCWDEVTTCSKSCNGKRKSERQRENKETRGEDEDEDARAAHKKSVKAQKAERRARLEFNGNPTSGQKACDECSKMVNELIRCQTDATKRWRMVCGSCWVKVSGGVVDGDANHPHYRYGGLWKNRRAQNADGGEPLVC